MTRVLGVDLGSKRIGVAVSDPTRTIATPLTVVARSGSRARDHRALAAIAAEEEVELVVIGLPLNMNGTEGAAARSARAEAREIERAAGVSVEMVDERRTTVIADRVMIEGGLDGRRRRRVVDRVAAAVLLQGWLDTQRGAP